MDTGLLEKLSIHYGLRDTANWLKVSAGYLSDNYIFTNGAERYFLKRYRYTDEAKIIWIHQVKRFFSAGQIPVIMPIETQGGGTWFGYEGRLYSLFPFVNGQVITRDLLTKTALESAGAMLARMHLLSKDGLSMPAIVTPKGWDIDDFDRLAALVEASILNRDHHDAFDNLALESVHFKRSLVEAETTRYEDYGLKNDHLVHGDYHETNMFFDNSGHVTHVFDFEKAKVSPRALEVARSMDFICFNGRYKNNNYNQAEIYLGAYTKSYPLTQYELETALRAYHTRMKFSLWVEQAHYLEGSSRTDRFLALEMAGIRFMADHGEEHIRRVVASLTARLSL